MRGQLKYDSSKVVSCGVCQMTAIVCPPFGRGGLNYPKEARGMGWRYTTKHGWVCPRHAAPATRVGEGETQ